MKALVLFSGGLDSTVLAAQLLGDGAETRLVPQKLGGEDGGIKSAGKQNQCLHLKKRVFSDRGHTVCLPADGYLGEHGFQIIG